MEANSMDMDPLEDQNPDAAARRRVQAACEACRASKIRCQPSEQPGVCRKCLDSKKECVLRTGPRTRRPRRPGGRVALEGQPPLPKPAPSATSSTFSINFEVPAQNEQEDTFDILRETHEHFVETVLPADDDDEFGLDNDSSFTGFPTPTASSSTNSQSIEDLHGKPQFNLSSAESLLKSFQNMLPQFPCVVVPPDATIPDLAATRPFVLLAILAAASGSKTLQGHSLYDAEFRKVLALKFVAGGERNIPLFQGLLVYCAWYPFHLRPKNKQIFNYIRMMGDMIHDLDLDQEIPDHLIPHLTEEQLDGIRAYVAFSYLSSAFLISWRVRKNLVSNISPWVLKCCDILEQHAKVDNDIILVYITRYASTSTQAAEVVYESRGQSEQQRWLLLLGLETQAREIQNRIPNHISTIPSMKLSSTFVRFYLDASPLLTSFPGARGVWKGEPFQINPDKCISCVRTLKAYYEYLLSLDRSSFSAFVIVDWCRLILCIIIGLRLCFRVSECPGYDPAVGRTELHLGEFLGKLCEDDDKLTPASKKVDVLSASRVVFAIVKEKYEKRMEAAARAEAAAAAAVAQAVSRGSGIGCPMLDGSVEDYYPLWDAELSAMPPPPPTAIHSGTVGSSNTAGHSSSTAPIFHDLWATMTMSWANDDDDGSAL